MNDNTHTVALDGEEHAIQHRHVTAFVLSVEQKPLGSLEMALLLSICHAMGWSADRISLNLERKIGIRLSAEQIWRIHYQWVGQRGGTYLKHDEMVLVKALLKAAGIAFKSWCTPLSRRDCPVSVKFAPIWYSGIQVLPQSTLEDLVEGETSVQPIPVPLFANYDSDLREEIRQHLVTAALPDLQNLTPSSPLPYCEHFSNPSPQELPLLALFGPLVSSMLAYYLRSWNLEMHRLPKENSDANRVKYVMNYLNSFCTSYEMYFGTMEKDEEGPAWGQHDKGRVYVRSTGYGAKVFLALMMADRLNAKKHLEEKLRRKVLLTLVAPEDLEPGAICPICRELLKQTHHEQVAEGAVRLDVCCRQIFGQDCLRQWLSHSRAGELKNSCPTCRYAFDEDFLQKFWEGAERPRMLVVDEAYESGSDDEHESDGTQAVEEMTELLERNRDFAEGLTEFGSAAETTASELVGQFTAW